MIQVASKIKVAKKNVTGRPGNLRNEPASKTPVAAPISFHVLFAATARTRLTAPAVALAGDKVFSML